MKPTLFPDERIDSAYLIDYEAFVHEGIRGVIFDIDNTLVPHGAPADDRAKRLFSELHALGLNTLVLSNNKEPRVKSFADAVGAMYIYKAGKPLAKGYLAAMEKMGTDIASTLFVGDQIFTDVWGASRLRIHTVLVGKIHPKEEIQIVLKRILEWFVLLAHGIYRAIKRQPRAVHVRKGEIA